MAKSALLDLFTEREQNFLTIDGVKYFLRDGNDLSLDHARVFDTRFERVQALENVPTPTPAQAEEYDDLLNQLLAIAIIDAPAAIVGALPRTHRAQAVATFIELSASSLLRTRAPKAAEAPAHGAKSSPVSSGSTAAPRRPGSRRPQSGRSART